MLFRSGEPGEATTRVRFRTLLRAIGLFGEAFVELFSGSHESEYARLGVGTASLTVYPTEVVVSGVPTTTGDLNSADLTCDSVSSSAGSFDSLAGLQSRTASVTGISQNTVKEHVVSFPVPFGSVPRVTLSPVSGVPQNVRVGIKTGTLTASGFTLCVYRTDTTSSLDVNWIATTF